MSEPRTCPSTTWPRSSSTAASLVLALTLLGATSACRDPSVRCASITGSLPGTVSFRQCSDGRVRKLECPRAAGQADAELMCACTVAGKMGASFTLFSDSVSAADDPVKAIRVGHRRCGWDLDERPAK